jgi:hypothetical protein
MVFLREKKPRYQSVLPLSSIEQESLCNMWTCNVGRGAVLIHLFEVLGLRSYVLMRWFDFRRFTYVVAPVWA